MNNFKVEIYDNKTKQYKDYTNFAVFPLKFANLLDEQLDEATLTLKGVSIVYFQPLSRVKITITNSPEAFIIYDMAEQLANENENPDNVFQTFLVNEKRVRQILTLNMLIANDRAVETPVGSGRYNHDIYLIELTKLLERFIGDSLTFTNALGNNFLGQNGENN